LQQSQIQKLGGEQAVQEAAAEWEHFKIKHSWCLQKLFIFIVIELHFLGKTYANASQEQHRFTIYAGNYQFVKAHNADPVKSKNYHVTINHLSDWVCSV